MEKQKITKPEICYEYSFFRQNTDTGAYLCINPKSFHCDKQGIGKATRACIHAELNPELIELYPETYEL